MVEPPWTVPVENVPSAYSEGGLSFGAAFPCALRASVVRLFSKSVPRPSGPDGQDASVGLGVGDAVEECEQVGDVGDLEQVGA